MWWRSVVVAAALVACTKSNPAKHCTDGTCIDPSYPFCDVTGAVSGEEGTCIASTCTADSFIECRGDVEVRCNVDGSDYNLTQCERGCDPAADGCQLCSPGETACTNGKLATCDATGAVVSATPCALGCYESEPRCREIDPSNGLGQYLDAVPGPPDLDLSTGSWTINTSTGVIKNSQNLELTVPSFPVTAPAGGVPIRVFIVGSATLGNVQVGVFDDSPALAIVARGNIRVTGYVEVTVGTGAVRNAGCDGSPGFAYTLSNGTKCLHSGSGGGANATNGGSGGDIIGDDITGAPGGTGGTAAGTDALIPLRGGCASGGYTIESEPSQGGIPGGGALQLTSQTNIIVSGTINATGGRSEEAGPQGCGSGRFGGGGGGSILLEAPIATLDETAQLIVRGGTEIGIPPELVTMYDGAGGVGASLAGGATDGGDATYVSSGVTYFWGGGGGGGWGRIRINTRDGTYTKSSASVEDGALTTGMVGTR